VFKRPAGFSSSGFTGLQGFLGPLVISLMALVSFAGTLTHDFVWDDRDLVDYARSVVEEKGPLALAGVPFFPVDEEETAGREYYRPVSLISFWVNDPFGQPDPFLFHGFNVILHILNSLLVFFLFRSVLGPGAGAFLGGLLFAVHPVHSESVAWVSGRTDLLAAFFILLTVLLWRRSRQDESFAWTPWILGLASFFLACLAKEVSFLLPVLALVWVLVDRRTFMEKPSKAIHPDLIWVVGMAIVAGLAVMVSSIVLNGEAGSFRALPVLVSEVGFSTAIWRVVKNLAVYSRLLFFPWPLKVYYPPVPAVLTLFTFLVSAGFVAFCLYFSARKHRRMGIVALAWTLLFLAPVSGVFHLGLSIRAERFCYLPSVGWAGAVGYALGIGLLYAPLRATAFRILVGFLVALLTIGSVLHSARWKDEVTLFEQAIRQNTVTIPNMYFNLGNAYVEAGDLPRGAEAFQEAIRRNPAYVDAILNLSSAFIRLGEHERALDVLEGAVDVASQKSRIWSNKGTALELLGKTEEALDSYSRAARLDTRDGKPHQQKGELLYRLGRFEESVSAYRESLAADPGELRTLIGLGRSLESLKLLAEAEKTYLRAVELEPEKCHGYLGLGRVLLGQVRAVEAVEVYRMALGLPETEREDAHKGLVLAYHMAGRQFEARRHVADLLKKEPELGRELSGFLEDLEEKVPFNKRAP